MNEVDEVLIDYNVQIKGPDKKMYGAKACGRQREDGRWEGWIEFQPAGGGEPIRSDRETTQPKRDHLVYWATGLTATYLEGALDRTLFPTPAQRPRPNPPEPRPEGPGEHPLSDIAYMPNAVLDPFRVYAVGADLLRAQLSALGKEHLVKIVQEYRLSTENPSVIQQMRQEDLILLIVKAVQARHAP